MTEMGITARSQNGPSNARPPVFVFQMGKVGSYTVKSTLTNLWNAPVVHGHNYAHLSKQDQGTLDAAKQNAEPLFVLCPIREPIGRNISSFFHNFERDTGEPFERNKYSTDDLRELFLSKAQHNVPIEWFDRNFRPVFGIDVFDEPFSKSTRYKEYSRENVRALVYQSELDPAVQLEIISQFLGVKLPQWDFENVSSTKRYARAYKQFKSRVRLPEVYLQMMFTSRYFRHFYHQDVKEALRQKWADTVQS